MDTLIGEILEQAPTISNQSINNDVDEIFQSNPYYEGVVVLDYQRPIGLVMKSRFYQKIGTQYGFNVYMRRPVSLVMKTSPLIVDHKRTIVDVCIESMNRPQDQLYDFVIITQEDRYLGVTSIRNLLLAFAEVKSHFALDLNPLTSLPGNKRIEQSIKDSLWRPSYSVLYLDLDRFKEYNDSYGFEKGDFVIRRTADIVKNCLSEQLESDNAFFGHLGGDDFIVIVPHYNYEPICTDIINRFENSLKDFYSNEDIIKGYIVGKTREGLFKNIPLIAISIAVVTNEVHKFSNVEELSKAASFIKRECKENSKSCFVKISEMTTY